MDPLSIVAAISSTISSLIGSIGGVFIKSRDTALQRENELILGNANIRNNSSVFRSLPLIVVVIILFALFIISNKKK